MIYGTPLDVLRGFRDFGFPQHLIKCVSRAGMAFETWVPVGMPRIPSEFLDCVCYLYANEEDAESGSDFGGTAFLIGYPSRLEGKIFIYAVTNWHVAVRDGDSCLRINTHGGKPDTLTFGPEDWEFDPRLDIAVRRVVLDPKKHKYRVIGMDGFLTQETTKDWGVGPGEDVFMVGRFIDHDGGPTNNPALRFGNISLMPSPMVQPNGKTADSFCIDLHSRSGYSGSPVIAYRTFGGDLTHRDVPGSVDLTAAASGRFLNLLGIHWGQFPEEWELRDKKSVGTITPHSVPLVTEGKYVKGLSGMTTVLPAWLIKEVLDMKKLADERRNIEDAIETRLNRTGKAVPNAMSAVASEASDQASGANPTHLEDFTSLLTAAAKTPPQDD